MTGVGRAFALLLVGFCVAAIVVARGIPVRASAYPERPVRIVVPYAPGGPVDLVSRVLSDKLSARYGQSFIIDNKPGANGVIGVQNVMQAPPDGYTLLMHGSAGVTIYQAVTRQPIFDTLRDLTPITTAAFFDLILCAGPDAPFKDVKGFMAYAKDHPGKISYGSAGIGAMNHVGTEWLKGIAGIDIVHVPYRGDAPVAADLMNGTIGVAFVSSNVALPYIQSGRLRALAVPSKGRLPAFPDVPTMAEAGYPAFDLRPWNGLFGPKGLPPEITASLGRAMKEILAMPDVIDGLAKLGMQAAYSTPAELEAIIRTDTERWKTVAAKAQIVVE